MKNFQLFILFFLMSLYAKAAEIKIELQNNSGQTVTIKWAVFVDNAPNDDELLDASNFGRFSDLFNNIQTGDKIHEESLNLSRKGILIIVGVFRLGGRTSTVIRKNLDQMARRNNRIEINLESPINAIEPSVDLDRFKEQIPSNLFGEYTDLIKQSIFGSFLLVEQQENGTFREALPLIPNDNTILKRFSGNYYKAEDVFERQILNNLNFNLPSLPIAFRAAMATKNYAQVTCEIFNSGKVDILPSNNKSYYDLFSGISNDDMQIAINRYKENPEKTKLLLVISANIIDSIRYSTNELRRVQITAKLDASTILTAEGNYSQVESSKQLSWETRKIGQVNIRNFAIYLQNEIDKREAEIAKNSTEDTIRSTYTKLQNTYPNIVIANLEDLKDITDELDRISGIDLLVDSQEETGEIIEVSMGEIENLQQSIDENSSNLND